MSDASYKPESIPSEHCSNQLDANNCAAGLRLPTPRQPALRRAELAPVRAARATVGVSQRNSSLALANTNGVSYVQQHGRSCVPLPEPEQPQAAAAAAAAARSNKNEEQQAQRACSFGSVHEPRKRSVRYDGTSVVLSRSEEQSSQLGESRAASSAQFGFGSVVSTLRSYNCGRGHSDGTSVVSERASSF
jgi:hypothetical protein